MIHLVFEHPYTKWLLALTMSVILAFAHEIDIFDDLLVYYIILAITGFMTYVSKYNDYGLYLLMIALLAIVYNKNANRHNKN